MGIGSQASSGRPDLLDVLDVAAVRRWALLYRSALATRRAEIDALNVFPVPDGDTGTNLYLTFDAAVDRTLATAAERRPGLEEDMGAGDLVGAFARHLLWTARGNSGVILSQLARGLAEASAGAALIDAEILAEALVRADDRAWQGVSEPKEGTILSVSKAAAEAARLQVGEGLHAVAAAAADAARQALARTPEQLPILAQAGVVDAGGAGLVLLLECLERVCAGDDTWVRPDPEDRSAMRVRWHSEPSRHPVAQESEPEATPEFEVMYLLADASDASVDGLRQRLVELGDSVLVVGGDGLWNVHAHVDDAGAAVEAGIAAGRPHRIRITALVSGTAHGHAAAVDVRREGAGIVACAAGEGLGELFRSVGAVVVTSGVGHRASTGQLIEAIQQQHATGVAGVVVLPNDGDTELAAAAAARAVAEDGIEVHVVRARTVVQGIAALAVFEPTSSADDNVLAMQSAASATRHGAVTIADRDALTTGGPCRAGDVLGIVDGDIVIVGSDQAVVGAEVVRRLLSSGGELLTIVTGSDTPAGLVAELRRAAHAEAIGLEVTEIHGGQPVYTVLLGVE